MRLDLLPSSLEGSLARLIEECGETLKAVGKLQRFGLKATDPLTKIEYDNVAKLHSEIDHLQHAIKEFRRLAAKTDAWREMWTKPFQFKERL